MRRLFYKINQNAIRGLVIVLSQFLDGGIGAVGPEAVGFHFGQHGGDILAEDFGDVGSVGLGQFAHDVAGIQVAAFKASALILLTEAESEQGNYRHDRD